MHKECKIAVFASGYVGGKVLDFLIANHLSDLYAIVFTSKNDALYHEQIAKHREIAALCLFNSDFRNFEEVMRLQKLSVDYFILAWWPFIIKEPLLSIPRIGIINFHPSLLPYNRGKNYNFWAIVEECPFGVSLHFIDNTIDGGDILFQAEIEKNWTDTGKILYEKAQHKIIELFCNSYERIRVGNYERKKQDLTLGSFHYEKEMNMVSKLELDKHYTGRELLNLLRAKTFPPHPGIWFEDDGVIYEINIYINQVNNN